MDAQKVVRVQSWAGVHLVSVEIIGETPKRYRVRILSDARWPGRRNSVKAGDVKLVPKNHVVNVEDLE